MEEVSELQTSRLTTLHHACSNSSSAYTNATLASAMADFLYVHDASKVIFCLVPKAGCTNIKRMLVRISTGGQIQNAEERFVHDVDRMYPLGIRRLSNFTAGERQMRLEQYYKIAVVRNPFVRWLSAYRDKFKPGNEYFTDVVGRMIIERYRQNATESDLMHGESVTFREFVKHLVDIGQKGYGFDDHWGPFELSCNPCTVAYDYIAKVETLDADMAFIKNHIYSESPYAVWGSKYNRSTNREIFDKYYHDIDSDDISKLKHYYRKDLTMFNYSFR